MMKRLQQIIIGVGISIRKHTSASVSIRQYPSAYVSIRQHTSAYGPTSSMMKRLQQMIICVGIIIHLYWCTRTRGRVKHLLYETLSY
jgi:hypothetical protein